jgi:hypothetical protein
LRNLLLAAAIVAAVLAAGLTKIADLDFWWHLKTGQLILASHSIPQTDVYSYSAFGREYVDHEWLFQVVIYATYSHFGPAGIALLKCLLLAATLIVVAMYAVRRGVDRLTAGGLVFLSIAGGISRFIERPELFSTLFSVLTFILCDTFLRTRNWRWLLPLPLIYAVWANVHAAVIVGLVIQILFLRSVPQLIALISSIAASLLNPVGYRVLTVPFELTRIIDSTVLNNEEWRRPTPEKVPFYFVALLLTAILFVWRFEFGSRTVARIAVAAFLAYISLKYIRNAGLFSVFMPLLIADEAARLSRVWRLVVATAGVIAVAVVQTVYFPFQRGFGEASYFPDGLVRFVKARNLQGHMLNSYGFGGYLIWSLYPERKVFMDGRNEVYLPVLQRVKVAADDSRAWSALLRDYAIEYTVLQYIDNLERVTTIDRSGHAQVSFAPFTATRFPRSRWALVYWDDDGMVFVKRGGADSTAGEYDAVFPEGRDYQRQLVATGTVDRAGAIAELQRKIAEDPGCRRARWLLAAVQKP